jgi:hypothetical protein
MSFLPERYIAYPIAANNTARKAIIGKVAVCAIPNTDAPHA